MKDILLLLLLVAFVSACQTMQKSSESGVLQPKEVLLVATSHDLRETSDQSISVVKNIILDFAPEQFFVELPPADDKYANEVVFGYSQNFELFHHLLNKKNIEIRMADSVIHQYQEKLQGDTSNPEYLGHLLHANLLKFDISNTLYYSFLLFSQYQDNDSVMKMINQTLLSTDTLDQYQLIVTGDERDEFSQIVFPVSKELGFHELFGFDNRDDEYAYNQALRTSDQELKSYVEQQYGITEEDSVKLKLERLLETDHRRNYPQEEMFSFLNSKDYDQYRKAEYDHRISLTHGKGSQNYLKYWKLRNRKMADNIAQAIEETNAKRSVVMVGAAHAWILEEMLVDEGYQVLRPFRDNP